MTTDENMQRDAEDARRYRYLKTLVKRRDEIPSGIARLSGHYGCIPEQITLHFEHTAPLHPGRVISFDEAVDVEERRAADLRVAMSQRRRATDRLPPPEASVKKPRRTWRYWLFGINT